MGSHDWETHPSAFCGPPSPCGRHAELGSAPGCSPRSSPVYHFAAEQMDDAEAPFFSGSSGENESHQVLPTPSYQVPHPSRTGRLTEHRPIPQPCSGAQWREEDQTNIPPCGSFSPHAGLLAWTVLRSRRSSKTEREEAVVGGGVGRRGRWTVMHSGPKA